MTGDVSEDPQEGPACGHPGCRREVDYRVAVPGGRDALRCRWHTDALWRPHGAAASVEPLHRDAPPIDTAASARRSSLPAVLLLALGLVVLVGFAALAPVLL